MKLPISLPFGKSEKQKYILALLLRDERVSAIITEEVEGKMRIVGQHEEVLSTPLEKLSEAELLDALDRTISRAEETLPPDRETHDTVFGVKESWVEDKKIKKEYLMQLKKNSEALSLTPIGFLVISEAMTHLIQEEEGAPVSAILVDIGTHTVTTTLVRGGKVLESKTSPAGESLPEAVDTAMKHFTSVEVFPSRLILFSGKTPDGDEKNIDELAQTFVRHHWSKSLPFLHPPQISVLAPGFDAKAVVQGAATQMGFTVLNLTHGADTVIKNYDKDLNPSETIGDAEEDTKKKHHGKHTEDAVATDAAIDELKDEGEETEPTASEDFGFLVDEEVTKPATHHAAAKHEQTEQHDREEHRNFVPVSEDDLTAEATEVDDGERTSPIAKLTALLPALSLPRFGSGNPLKGVRFAALISNPRGKLLIIPIILLLLICGLYFYYTSTVKAEVTLYMKPNNVSETAEVTFSTESGNNFSESIINATTVSADLDGSVTGQVTGKKSIGEKAKGTVTVFNNDDARRQLAAGTTITTEKGLKFTLDKEVSIASASGDIFTGTKPGTAQVAVTASEIGTDYNLPSGTKFNVSGGSNIAARNDSAFSGGTKKDVTVVSKKDQDKLLADLSKSLQDKAKEALVKNARSGETLLPFLTQASVTKREFDRKLDQEAKTLKLEGTVSFEALTYSENDLKDFAEVALKNKYDDNLNLSEKGLTLSVADEKQEGEGEVTAVIRIEGGLVPKLDTTALIEKVRGKSVASATDELGRLPQVSRTEVTFSPSIPFIPVSLPNAAERITLKTALDE